MKSKNASSLRTTLQSIAESVAVLETFDIKYIPKRTRTKMDLRLKNNSGRLEVVAVKKEEQKVVVFDLLCLHRQDMCLQYTYHPHFNGFSCICYII